MSMSGTVTARRISVYDYEQGCHVTGSGTSLYHYGNHAHIALNLNGANFSGYGSKAHFSGGERQGRIAV